MSFLNPLAWALAALALPILALYLLRQRSSHRKVTTLLFWEQLQPKVRQHPFWLRLRQWPSFLLQLLMLLLLVAVLAHPVLTRSGPAEAERLLLIVDTSASMAATDGSRSRLGYACDQAATFIERLGRGVQATLISTGEGPQVVQPWTDNKRLLKQGLDRLTPASGSGDLEGALKLARNLASPGSPGYRIVTFTDGIAEPTDDKRHERVRWVDVRGESGGPNAGLTLFSARRSGTEAGGYRLLARVAASRASEGWQGSLSLYRNGQLRDAAELDLAPGESWERLWSERGEEQAGYRAVLDPAAAQADVLAADNAASLNLPALPVIRVALVGPPDAFLKASLAVQPRVRVEMLNESELRSPDVDKMYDFWVFHRVVPPERLNQKPLLLIAPDFSGFWGMQVGEAERPAVVETASDSDIMTGVDFQRLRIASATIFEPAAVAKTYAEAVEAPLLFGRWEHGGARWLVLPFSLEAGDLVLRTAFPVLMGNIVHSLRPEAVRRDAGLPGMGETSLRARLFEDGGNAATVATDAPAGGNWPSLPLWWWGLLVAFAWCLSEWWLFTRRVTE